MEHKGESALFVEERKKRILELLRENNKVLVADLCRMFNISPATARNDLTELANMGLLQRTYGGAMLAEQASYELTTQQKVVRKMEEKRSIAAVAASHIKEGDSIALDTGTTTMELARHICDVKDLTVILNDIEIALFLENNSEANVVLVGGKIRRGFHCSVGSLAVEEISKFSVDKVFIAANALNERHGLATPDLGQAEIKKAFMSIAAHKIALIDSSKIGRTSFSHFASIQEIDLLITDENANPEAIKALADSGLKIVQAKLNR